jgi:hypothetical protein
MIQEIYYILGSISFCIVLSSKYLCKCFEKKKEPEDFSYIRLEEVCIED